MTSSAAFKPSDGNAPPTVLCVAPDELDGDATGIDISPRKVECARPMTARARLVATDVLGKADSDRDVLTSFGLFLNDLRQRAMVLLEAWLLCYSPGLLDLRTTTAGARRAGRYGPSRTSLVFVCLGSA